jgi:hypothetical protein
VVECVKYTIDYKEKWDMFVKACNTCLFFFNRDYMEYHSDRFIDFSLIFLDKGEVIAVLPATIDGNIVSSHSGLTYGGLLLNPRIRYETILEVLLVMKKTLAEAGCVKLVYKVVPYIFHGNPSDEVVYALHQSGASISRRDLSTVISLRNRLKLSKGRKSQISRARKNGIKIVDSNDWNTFHSLLSSVLVAHSAKPVHSSIELEYLAGKFPSNISLKTACLEGEMVAAILLFVFDGVVHTQYIAANSVGRELGALDMLLENSIKEYQNNEFKYFSFGISTENYGKTINLGLLNQKEGFGGRGLALDVLEIDLDD